MKNTYNTNKTNEIQRFIFRDLNVLGGIIFLNSAWQNLIKNRNYSPEIQQILGGLAIFSVLFADKMKRDVELNFQLKAVAPAEFVRVEAIKEIAQNDNKENSIFLRGMARSNDKFLGKNDFISDEKSYLLMNLKLENNVMPYQSFVPLVVENKKLNLQKTLNDFLQLSEQQESYIKLFITNDFAGGIFLQKMPESNAENESNIDEDAFNRLCNFANTLTENELKNLDNTEILFKLFNEDIQSLKMFIAENIYYRNKNNSYDEKSIIEIIKSMGKENAFKLLNENNGKIIITDEMSNENYELSQTDLIKIFSTSI